MLHEMVLILATSFTNSATLNQTDTNLVSDSTDVQIIESGKRKGVRINADVNTIKLQIIESGKRKGVRINADVNTIKLQAIESGKRKGVRI